MSRYKLKKKKTPAESLRQEAGKVNWKLWLVTFLLVAAIFALYQICVALYFKYIIHIYSLVLFVCALCYGIINRGFSNKKITAEDLPHDWEPERKKAFIADVERRRKKAKPLLIPVIGILVTFAYDIIFLFYIEPLL